MFKYSVNVIWSDIDDSYVATIPEFPGLSAFGETPEDAAREAKIAAEGFIEVYKEDGCKIPEPKKLQQFSGQIRLRLPKSLHTHLSEQAENEGISLNTHIVSLLAERNALEKVTKKLDTIENCMVDNILKDIDTASSGANLGLRVEKTNFGLLVGETNYWDNNKSRGKLQ